MQEIFADEIAKKDSTFFIRLEDGFLHKEDKYIEATDFINQHKHDIISKECSMY